MDVTTIALCVYLFGIPVDIIDSRRLRLGYGKALLYAPFWPFIWVAKLLARI